VSAFAAVCLTNENSARGEFSRESTSPGLVCTHDNGYWRYGSWMRYRLEIPGFEDMPIWAYGRRRSLSRLARGKRLCSFSLPILRRRGGVIGGAPIVPIVCVQWKVNARSQARSQARSLRCMYVYFRSFSHMRFQQLATRRLRPCDDLVSTRCRFAFTYCTTPCSFEYRKQFHSLDVQCLHVSQQYMYMYSESHGVRRVS